MITDFAKGFGQLSDPRARGVVWKAIGVAALVFALLWLVVGYGLVSTALIAIGWLDTTLDFLGGATTLVLTWFLFPAIITGVMSTMLDGVVKAVEARHYPDLEAAKGTGLAGNVFAAVRFLLITISLNLLALPFLLLGPVYPIIFLAINGYLFGREYFEVAALGRVQPAEAAHLMRRNRMSIIARGAGIAFLLTIPVVNLFAPVVAAATMTHLFHRVRGELKAAVL